MPSAGNVIVGDDIEANGTETLRLLADNQIPHLDLLGTGLTTLSRPQFRSVDFNGHTDTIGNLVMNLGVTDSGDIDLNGGTLTLGGASITVNAFQGSSGVSPAGHDRGRHAEPGHVLLRRRRRHHQDHSRSTTRS